MEISNKSQKEKGTFPSFPPSSTFVFSSGKQVQTRVRSAALVQTASINNLFSNRRIIATTITILIHPTLCMQNAKGINNSVREEKAITLCILVICFPSLSLFKMFKMFLLINFCYVVATEVLKNKTSVFYILRFF